MKAVLFLSKYYILGEKKHNGIHKVCNLYIIPKCGSIFRKNLGGGLKPVGGMAVQHRRGPG